MTPAYLLCFFRSNSSLYSRYCHISSKRRQWLLFSGSLSHKNTKWQSCFSPPWATMVIYICMGNITRYSSISIVLRLCLQVSLRRGSQHVNGCTFSSDEEQGQFLGAMQQQLLGKYVIIQVLKRLFIIGISNQRSKKPISRASNCVLAYPFVGWAPRNFLAVTLCGARKMFQKQLHIDPFDYLRRGHTLYYRQCLAQKTMLLLLLIVLVDRSVVRLSVQSPRCMHPSYTYLHLKQGTFCVEHNFTALKHWYITSRVMFSSDTV